MESMLDQEPAVLSDQLAMQRTLMAASRTLLAWTRTGMSQISFGFTIYKVLDDFEKQGKLTPPYQILTPDRVGMILLALGMCSIVFGIIVSVVACQQGMQTTGGAVGVGQSTTRTVVISMVLIYVANFVLASLLY